mmetsp:Transcript_73026/g.202580  ORF Transcript_73026/g.202580 Transcript_73026/m.202580 type:complete len:368 (+) Transcript_73026:91-1194(+)
MAWKEQPQLPSFLGLPAKYIVLCLLVFQNAGAVLLMRAVRAMPGETEFITQTAVILQEVLKASACIVLVLYTEGSLSGAWRNYHESLRTAFPAMLYLVQNNLQYLAVSHLDAPTYAVTYQTKMVWVAVCSVIFLGKQIERHQWTSLFCLTVGVCMVQVSQASPDGLLVSSWEMKATGLLFVLVAALCSSLAAVSFEKLLKGVTMSLWMRNLQLAFFSLFCAVGPLLVSDDGARVQSLGFFHGYTVMTWSCIIMNSAGGLLVGAVISFADAILKDIAIGASIVVSALGSICLFEFKPTINFALGVVLVSYAVLVYSGHVDPVWGKLARKAVLRKESDGSAEPKTWATDSQRCAPGAQVDVKSFLASSS